MQHDQIKGAFLSMVEEGWDTDHILAYFWGRTNTARVSVAIRGLGIKVVSEGYEQDSLVRVKDLSSKTEVVFTREHIEEIYYSNYKEEVASG